MIGCDLVVTTSAATLDLVRGDSARIVVNSDVVPTAQFQSNQAIDLSQDRLLGVLAQRVPRERISAVPATSSAVSLMGDSIATNVFMLGFAIQEGLMPVALQAIEQAINLNGVAIEQNLHALNWGRLAAHDPKRFAELLARRRATRPGSNRSHRRSRSSSRGGFAISRTTRMRPMPGRIRSSSRRCGRSRAARVPGSTAITKAVAFSLSKLMSYKDEYEVARLYTNGDFLRRLTQQFDGNYKLNFHLSPPIFNPRDKATGKPRKVAFGPWMLTAFKVAGEAQGPARHGLRRLRLCRGTTHRAPADRGLPEDDRGRAARCSIRRTPSSWRRSPRCPT